MRLSQKWSEKQRIVMLQEKQHQKSERVKNESEEERNITLEEQRHHNLRHQ
jgi:hypothetical protein